MLTFGQFSGRRGQSRSIWPVFFASVPLEPGSRWSGAKKLVQSAPKHLQTAENVETKTASRAQYCSVLNPHYGRLKVLGGRLDQFFGPRSSGAWLQWHWCKKNGSNRPTPTLRPKNQPKVSIVARWYVPLSKLWEDTCGWGVLKQGCDVTLREGQFNKQGSLKSYIWRGL